LHEHIAILLRMDHHGRGTRNSELDIANALPQSIGNHHLRHHGQKLPEEGQACDASDHRDAKPV
jgi:hypothetical protein